MTQKEKILSEVKGLLIELLNLQHLNPDGLTANTRLLDDLELDSIDILELVVGIENRYGIKIESPEKGKEIFQNLGSISDFILSRQSSP